MYGDPDEIRRLAARMRDRAGDLRGEADRLVGAAESTAWVSSAADRMRERVRERGGQLRETATAYVDAAEKLEAHAREVEELIALIASIERKVTGLISAAADRVADTARAIASGVKDLFTDDDAQDEALANYSTPPSGDKAWLDVPDSLGVRV